MVQAFRLAIMSVLILNAICHPQDRTGSGTNANELSDWPTTASATNRRTGSGSGSGSGPGSGSSGLGNTNTSTNGTNGNGSGGTTPAPAPGGTTPAPAPGGTTPTPEAGSATITQVVTFTSITVEPTGALLNTINYAVALAQGIGEIQSNVFVFFTGCSITSTWAAARRVGMSATFKSIASAAKATAATASAGSITPASLSTSLNIIKNGTTAASQVTVPTVGVVQAPVVVVATAAPSPPTTASAPAKTTMSVVAVFSFVAIMKQLF